MSNRKEVTPEYVYITVPAEYVCVYHKILAMLADYGEEMLKDCKASCTERNSGVIECFNMFNAAVAARHIGQEKKATLIINYIKAKINQIYKGKPNNPGYVFPVDENGALKAFVSCNDRPRFWIDEDELLKQDQGLGYREEYSIIDENNGGYRYPFDFDCEANIVDGKIQTKLTYYINGAPIEESELSNVLVEYYVDEHYVEDLSQYTVTNPTTCKLKVFAYYNGGTNNHTYILSNYE